MSKNEIDQARYEAWREAEAQKMDAMSMHEKADYLVDHYGLDCDVSVVGYDYLYLNPKM